VGSNHQDTCFEASGHKFELIPHFDTYTDRALSGFSLIVHRKVSLTLPYLCARTLQRLHDYAAMFKIDNLKVSSEQRRLLLTEIGNTKTLKETVILLSEYLQSIFSLSKHEVIQSFTWSDSKRLLVGLS
jgi:hypothetical protein